MMTRRMMAVAWTGVMLAHAAYAEYRYTRAFQFVHCLFAEYELRS